MRADQSWIGERAFGDDAGDLVTVTYKSHQDALGFLNRVIVDPKGVGFLEGPPGSGKTTTAKRFAEVSPRDIAIAFVDGSQIKPRELLSRILSQFGYDTGLESIDGLFKMLSMFAGQQTRAGESPMIIVDNADDIAPDVLAVLNALAALSCEERFALRLILTGGERLAFLVRHESMTDVAKRSIGYFQLEPMSLREALLYLHARLGACGVNNADTVFPLDVCDHLYQRSGGWPGQLNRFAVEAIGRAREFPVRGSDTYPQSDAQSSPSAGRTEAVSPAPDETEKAEPLLPELVVTKDGCLVRKYVVREKKVLLGRSDFADIIIDDDYASKIHILFLYFPDAMILLDLNSANGTTVNSVRVHTMILKSGDIITIGHHRIKVRHAPAIRADMAELLKKPDTVRMKHLADIRKGRLRRAELRAIQGRKDK